ncbi:MAG: recombinase family protein [Hungatella sp.]|nr:recombinase family protein [Hungatella sp.]
MARIRESTGRAAGKAPGKVWRVAAYIRLSREDGNDESLSVTNQKKIIREYLETRFEGEFTLVDWYVDDGLTGTDYDRPDFQRMLCDVEAKKVNCVVCKNLSRMFRNYSDQGYFLEKIFPMNNTRFITVSEPKVDSFLHPETLQGLEVPINGLMNDRFAAKTSMDVRDTFATKRRKGEFIGAFAPYGYKKASENKNALVIDQEAAEVVRTIYQWFVYEGMSKNGIARRLNDLGVLNPAAYKKSKGSHFFCPQGEKNDGLWSASSVAAILKNQMYTGTMVQGRQKVISYKVHKRQAVPKEDWYMVPNTHEPVIEAGLFEKAEELRRRDTRTAPDKRNVYLLSGFVRCADCKKAMTRQKTKDMVYYYCRTYREKSKQVCTKHSIKEEVIVKAALKAVQAQISLIDSGDRIWEELNRPDKINSGTGRFDAMLNLKGRELKRVTAISDGLYGDWKNGDISREEYVRLKAKYAEQAKQIRSAMEHIWGERQAAERDGSGREARVTEFLRERNVRELDRGLVAALIKNIYIHEGGEITIEFNFADRGRGDMLGGDRGKPGTDFV